MALIAVVLASLVLPLTKAMALGSTPVMAMNMSEMDMSQMDADANAMPCTHGSNKPPCCPEPCRDMAVCVVGCFVAAETAPQVVFAPFTYTIVGYGYAAEHKALYRSVAPPSRPPIS